jgi:hypothetical protein
VSESACAGAASSGGRDCACSPSNGATARSRGFGSRATRVDHAAELDDGAVAGALDDAAVTGGDSRVDEVAAEAAKACERTLLVGPDEPAVADDICD